MNGDMRIQEALAYLVLDSITRIWWKQTQAAHNKSAFSGAEASISDGGPCENEVCF